MSTEVADPLPADLAGQIAMVNDATDRLLASVDEALAAGADAGLPSLCAGWTAGHVLTHLARNADGLRRAAEGARRGELVGMYDSAEARENDIEAGAARPLPELADDVRRASLALRATWAAMTEADWARPMAHHRVGKLPVSNSPVMRLYETLIHHVDLDWPYGPADWPAAFVADVMADAAATLDPLLPAGVGVEVRATDTGTALTVGSGGSRVSVSGPSWALACWVVGRPARAAAALAVDGGDLPVLAAQS